jgi:hypothetical protein
LAAGDFATAAELAHQAEQAQSTDQGSALRLLCQWLNATRS